MCEKEYACEKEMCEKDMKWKNIIEKCCIDENNMNEEDITHNNSSNVKDNTYIKYSNVKDNTFNNKKTPCIKFTPNSTINKIQTYFDFIVIQNENIKAQEEIKKELVELQKKYGI
ncbi:hypothetical protein NAPIS_ORF02768 [Vairimorpha apis BRL 01]|uniref:Uncharacterized protein n=1 Tax=Vairimorpha apis BRL 01 TaxID=1037528 RepID=T0KVY8_9MICR|nr:hypothetical protein NAPIS_ORF02768 [Vairimorpha apis BRL 01]